MSDGGRSEPRGWVHVRFCLVTLARSTVSAGESSGDGSGAVPMSVAVETGSVSSMAISERKLERCWLDGGRPLGGRAVPLLDGRNGRGDLDGPALVEPRIMAQSASGNDCQRSRTSEDSSDH